MRNWKLNLATYLVRGATLSLLLLALLPQTSRAEETLLASLSRAISAKQVDKRCQTEVLKVAPSLAFVPLYTGQNAVQESAVRYLNLPGGDCYNVKYLVMEDAKTAHDWYRDALKRCGWQLDSDSLGDVAITAHREPGMCCFVHTGPSNRKGFRTEVVLRYSVRPM